MTKRNDTLTLTGVVDIKAGSDEGEEKNLPTFSMVAYTGVPMQAGGFYNPVVVDLSGVKSAESVAILLDHDPSLIVGQGTAKVDGGQIVASGTIMAEDDNSKKLTTLSRNGFRWQASIGASITRREFLDAGKTATVNGKQVTGPMVIARESVLREISFVALGADSNTSAAIAASHNRKGDDMGFNEFVVEAGFDPDNLTDKQRNTLQAMFDAKDKPQGQSKATTLDSITAAARAERERQEQVTAMAEQFIRENPHKIDEIEAIAKAACADKNTTMDRLKLLLIEATQVDLAQFGNRHRRTELPSGSILEAGICQAARVSGVEKMFDERVLEAADRKWRGGLGLQELLLTAARVRGYDGVAISTGNMESVLRAAFATDVRGSGFSTISVSSILSNVANKFVTEAFLAVEDKWRLLSAVRPVRDFKQITSHSLTGDLTYEKLGPGGEIRHGNLGEEVYTNKADTYAKMLAITRTDIINDDLGAFAAVPRRLGRGGALQINNVFWREFLDNATFFTEDRGNYDVGASDTALDATGLKNAVTLYDLLEDPDGNPLGSMAKYLVVPPALWEQAQRLMQSTTYNTGGAATAPLIANANPYAGMFEVVKSTYLSNDNFTGASAKAWYLIADPADIPVIETVFLNGRDMPVVETADADFDRLGIKMRAYHDFGVKKQEFRGGIKMKGEN